MTKPERRKLKASLQARVDAITDNASKREEIAIQTVSDTIDAVQLSGDRDLAIALLHQETMLLQELRAALHRVENGSYGVCLQCEEEISPKRLAAVPWADRCIQCQEAFDRSRQSSPETAGDLINA